MMRESKPEIKKKVIERKKSQETEEFLTYLGMNLKEEIAEMKAQ